MRYQPCAGLYRYCASDSADGSIFSVDAFCFSQSSTRLHDWFTGTDLYKKNLESYVRKEGMQMKTKVSIVATVTLLMASGITTKPTLIKRAKELGLFTILRLFLIDSMAYENIDRQVKSSRPDLIEILPALMPKVIAKVCQSTSTPVIAGGLVSEKEDILALLDAGATSISSTNEKIWFL